MEKCLIIGEVAQAHDGSLGMAHAYIDAIANAGADAIKFQTHIADAESSRFEPWRVKFSKQDKSRFDYWKRMEFTEEQWIGLKEHSESVGLEFISSPFSIVAVELLERIGVKRWKIASGEVMNAPLIDTIIQTKKPILLSSGVSSYQEIDEIVKKVNSSDCDLTIFQCTTAYPVAPEKLGLNILKELRDRYSCKVGLSDHSGTIFPGLAAATLGVDAIEVHVTVSRECFGPDTPASVTTSELKTMVDGIRFIETAIQSPVDKDSIAADLRPIRSIFTKSAFTKMNLSTNTVIESKHLEFKKPGTGIPPSDLTKILGKRIKRNIEAGDMLQYDDIEN